MHDDQRTPDVMATLHQSQHQPTLNSTLALSHSTPNIQWLNPALNYTVYILKEFNAWTIPVPNDLL